MSPTTDTGDGVDADASVEADSVPDRAPTRTSTAIAAGATLSLVAVLLSRAGDVLVPALAGVGGVVALAVSLELLGVERWHTPGTVVASLLTLPVAAGLVVGSLGTVLVLLGSLFPVARTGQIPGQSLRLLGRLGIVVGAVLGVFGASLGVRGTFDSRRLARYFGIAAKTAVLPLLAAVLTVSGTMLSKEVSGDPGATAGTFVADTLGWLLGPGGATTHAGSFLLLVAVAAWAARAGIGALPVAELLGDSGTGEVHERRVTRARGALGTVAGGAFVVGVLGAGVEAGVEPQRLRQTLGPGPYGLLGWVTSASLFRLPLVGGALLSLLAVAAGAALKWFTRASVDGFVRRSAPLVVGAAVTAGAVVSGDAVYAALLAAVTDRLPAALAEEARSIAGAFADFYGEGTIVVGLAATLIVLTGLVALCLWVALRFGYLSDETGGYALAAAGLFAASAFAGTLGAPAWLVFGGVAVSLLVWDAGEFGVALGREIGGRAPTGRAELVHAGGTVIVGFLGVLVATSVTQFSGGTVQQSPATVVALVSVLVGIVLLIAALR